MSVWNSLLRPLLFRLPAERVHHLSMGVFDAGCRLPGAGLVVRQLGGRPDKRLAVRCMNLNFPSPVCLAAGFDKDVRWFSSLGKLGFGAIESGSVTGQAQPGNPPPRLFRLPEDHALINRMGFNSRGAEAVANSLHKRMEQVRRFRKAAVLGINLGKSKSVPLQQAADDYEFSLTKLFPFADYFVVNVSSPNTSGLRDLQQVEMLQNLANRLIGQLDKLAGDANSSPPPLLLKIAPDLTDDQIDEIAGFVLNSRVSGVIATNTTISRTGLKSSPQLVMQIGDGGLSGKPLAERSLEVVSRLYGVLQGKKTIIGVGGIFDGDDAWQMITAGANLVQLYTGFIYGGPGCVHRIHRGLVHRMDQAGIKSIQDAAGKSAGSCPGSPSPSPLASTGNGQS